MIFINKGIRLVVVLALLLSPGLIGVNVCAELQDVVDTKDQQDIIVYIGDIVTMQVHSLTRVSVSKPNVVNIVNADINNITIIGKNVGETTFYVWDEYGKRAIYVRVMKDDLDRSKASAEKLMAAANVEGVTLEKDAYTGKLIASGRISKGDTAAIEATLEGIGKHVISLYDEGGSLIQLDVQITELSTTLTKVLGFDWGSGGSSGMRVTYEETLPDFTGKFDELFKIGDFNRTMAINATVNALITEGKARVLSKPSIVVADGEEAEFNVGGEIPVRSTTTSTSGNTVTENITYTTYGVTLTVTPTLTKDKIDVELNVDIRDIDASNAVGENVAFTTRTATTEVFLNDGQTIVLAGLIKHNTAVNETRVPFLGSIPVLGLLFRNRSESPNTETEVVISITPRIISQEKMAQAADDDAMEEMNGQEDTLEEDWLKESDLWDEALPDEGEQATVDMEDEAMLLEKEMAADAASLALAETEQMTEASSQAITRYVQSVQQKIARGISFPYEAKEKGWSGTVVLTLGLLSDGSLTDVSVKESSGQKVFDKDAVNTTQILAPFSPFPAEVDLEELEVTIPIVYSKEAVFDGENSGS